MMIISIIGLDGSELGNSCSWECEIPILSISLLHLPLFMSTSSSSFTSDDGDRGEVLNFRLNPQRSNSSSPAQESSTRPHHPYSSEHTSSSSEQEGEENVPELIQIKLAFFKFSIGWILRDSLALLIWLISMSPNTVRWRKFRKVLKVLRDACVAESN
ncbi:hypothetical protein PSTT_06812 [Puccinia striiformis]|uniref:Uncharacterized protein n=1 Tax=Puccinia striiformis TaxID=27350 RepID=A0A2S4VIR9_9BASI|nr:hypothetical protein PSTT_06812 [Puccinia striiformis]